MYTDNTRYTDYDYGLTDGVSCALPDLRYVVFVVIGAVVAALAIGVWAVRRLRAW